MKKEIYKVDRKMLKKAKELGHCPCNLEETCPCSEFLNSKESFCKCGAYRRLK